MSRLRVRLGRGLLLVTGLLATGLALVLLIPPAAAAVAAPRPWHDAKIYYDPPAEGGQSPATYVIAAKWDKNPVTYSFQNCPSALPCDIAQQQVREAIEAWDAVCGLTLNEVPAEGDIRVGWYSGDHGDGNPFDGPGGVLGHSFFPIPSLGALAGDIHLDDSEAWVAGTPTSSHQVHLKTVAMHEAGHALGLDHSSDPSALMWAEYSGIRSIGPDDLAGIQALYGPASPDEGGPAATVPPQPPASVTATATTTVRVRSGPGTDFPQVGSIDAGQTVPVVGKNAGGDWLYVDANGTRGWAAIFLFTVQGDLNTVPVVDQNGGTNGTPLPPPPAPTTEPAQPTSEPPNPGGVTGVTLSTVRVRSGPGTNYAPVGAVDQGLTVQVVARNGNNTWVFIQYNDIQGWVATWLLTITGDINTLPVLQPVF